MIPFTKAHACGNDFLIVPTVAMEQHSSPQDLAAPNFAELARRLCERNTGIGGDGVEFFHWIDRARRHARIRLFNADGSIAEISGNGTRCVAAYMAEQLQSRPGEALTLETDAGPRHCRIDAIAGNQYQVTSGMGIPEFAHKTVTLADGTAIAGLVVNTGNPHFVVVAHNDDFTVALADGDRPWPQIGEAICRHPDFPQQTNVEFLRILGPSQIGLRIFERGVGPTTSSGTGTSAAATAAIVLGLAPPSTPTVPLTVIAPGGAQTVVWSGPNAKPVSELELTGPAALIARGEAW